MFERFKKFVQKIYDFFFSELVAEIIITYSILLIILGAILYVYFLGVEWFIVELSLY